MNRMSAITRGWDEPSAILVAVDAEPHKMANIMPAIIHLYFSLSIKSENTGFAVFYYS